MFEMARASSLILPLYGDPEIEVVESHDCRLTDSNGKHYLDFESGVWCANLGHNHPEIRVAAFAESEHLIHHGYHFCNRHAEALSAALLWITALGEGKSVFLSSGSEAIELAIKLAMAYTGRSRILRIANTYLSAYGFGRLGGDNPNRIDIAPDDVDAIDRIDFREIAAIVIETGGASAPEPIHFPDRHFLETLVATGRRSGCVIVADEVTTGMGRTGKWFGFMHYDVQPDIVATGKALGNGYPVSGVTVNAELADVVAAKPVRYAQSHQNDPLGCAIGCAVIRAIDAGGYVERSRAIGDVFRSRLEGISAHQPGKVAQVRSRGLAIAIQFADRIDARKLGRRLFDAGFVVGCGNKSLRFMPPLTIGESEIESLCLEIERNLADES
jgi:acetylornithine/N-succinyldiaminopimelate aminotransferase